MTIIIGTTLGVACYGGWALWFRALLKREAAE